MLYSVPCLHRVIIVVHVWWRTVELFYSRPFCTLEMSLFTVIPASSAHNVSTSFLIICCTDTQNDLGILISQVTETDIYLICSLEGTGRHIRRTQTYSALIWPEEKPMIICLCRLKTYTGNIFIHEHILPPVPTDYSPGHTERYSSSLPSEILALFSFD